MRNLENIDIDEQASKLENILKEKDPNATVIPNRDDSKLEVIYREHSTDITTSKEINNIPPGTKWKTAKGTTGYIYAVDVNGDLYEIKNANLDKNLILQGKNIVQVSDEIAVDNLGKVYVWGWNGYGQLGNGTNENSDIPICISEIQDNPLYEKNIVMVSSQGSHKMALDDAGNVYTWGWNVFGQLGNGSNENNNIPICISEIEESQLYEKSIVDISAGKNFSIAVDSSGKVYTWGYNAAKSLGNGTRNNSNIPICISEIDESILGEKTIVEVSVGHENVMALDNMGSLYAWGYSYGVYPISLNNIIVCNQISMGMSHIIILDNNGKVYTAGNNDMGQLGHEDLDNYEGAINDIPGHSLNGKKIKEVSAGGDWTTIIDNNGQIYIYGGVTPPPR